MDGIEELCFEVIFMHDPLVASHELEVIELLHWSVS